MALLSNMSIERTIGHMSSSSGAGGYRYLGGEGITVDNDLYKISVDYNPETLTIDADSKLTFNYSFLQSGDNVSINYEDGHLVISAAMFQSQFEDGDKVKYDRACLNLAQAQLDITTIKGNITAIQGDINAITGENGDLELIDTRLDTLEDHDSSHDGRLDTLEDHDTDHETRLTAAEGTIAAHTTTISANDTRSRTNAQNIEIINQTIETLTGYSGDIGNLAQRVTIAEGNISTNADNISANSAAIQSNADAIALINLAIDDEDTGYAARITSVENVAATNTGLIAAMNTRLDALDPQGAAAGSSISDRLQAAEDDIDRLDTEIGGLGTTVDGVSSVANQASSDLSDLTDAYNSYTTATDGRLDTLEAFQTDAEGDIDDLEATDIVIGGRLDTLEGINADNRLTSLESFQSSASSTIETNTNSISSLQTTVGSHTTSINQLSSSVQNKEDKLSSFYYLDAPEATYTLVTNDAAYDPDYSYFFADPITYSQYYPEPTYVDAENDTYDSSINYYTYDAQNDQYAAYTYVDAETFASDAANGLIHFEYPAGIQLYESDGGTGYTAFNGSIDPSDTYYEQDPVTYSDRYVPEISRVESGASYDNTVTYFTLDLRGNMNAYTYVDSTTFDAAVASGLYFVSNWSAALAANIYKKTYTGASSAFTIPAPMNGIATVSSGVGNTLVISINGSDISVTAADNAETSLTFAFTAQDFITGTVLPVNHGSGVRGAVYARYFGTSVVTNPDIVTPGQP